MMTKKEERAALEKIRNILSGLDNDSYIATAFDGCIDDAERNINEDAMYSMKNRCSALETKLQGSAEMIEKLNRENAELKAKLDAGKERMSQLKEALASETLKRKEIRINDYYGNFKKFQLLPGFVKVEQNDGWTDCYKFEDIKSLTIE